MQTSLALARAQLRHGWRSLVGIVVLGNPDDGDDSALDYDLVTTAKALRATELAATALRHQPAKVLRDE